MALGMCRFFRDDASSSEGLCGCTVSYPDVFLYLDVGMINVKALHNFVVPYNGRHKRYPASEFLLSGRQSYYQLDKYEICIVKLL